MNRFARPCLNCGIATTDGNRCRECRLEFQKERHAGLRKPYANPEWRKLSRQVRAERPYCEACGSTEDLTADHIVPLSRGGDLIVPLSELRVLCRVCHGKLTKH